MLGLSASGLRLFKLLRQVFLLVWFVSGGFVGIFLLLFLILLLLVFFLFIVLVVFLLRRVGRLERCEWREVDLLLLDLLSFGDHDPRELLQGAEVLMQVVLVHSAELAHLAKHGVDQLPHVVASVLELLSLQGKPQLQDHLIDLQQAEVVVEVSCQRRNGDACGRSWLLEGGVHPGCSGVQFDRVGGLLLLSVEEVLEGSLRGLLAA